MEFISRQWHGDCNTNDLMTFHQLKWLNDQRQQQPHLPSKGEKKKKYKNSKQVDYIPIELHQFDSFSCITIMQTPLNHFALTKLIGSCNGIQMHIFPINLFH